LGQSRGRIDFLPFEVVQIRLDRPSQLVGRGKPRTVYQHSIHAVQGCHLG
jgi:hypothetical protein